MQVQTFLQRLGAVVARWPVLTAVPLGACYRTCTDVELGPLRRAEASSSVPEALIKKAQIRVLLSGGTRLSCSIKAAAADLAVQVGWWQQCLMSLLLAA